MGSNLIDHTRINNNIVEAVVTHFNEIQSGNFHTNSPNYINPNTHNKTLGIDSNLNTVVNSPLDQFLIKEFLTVIYNFGGNFKLLFTNMTLYLLIATFIASSLNLVYGKLKRLVSSF